MAVNMRWLLIVYALIATTSNLCLFLSAYQTSRPTAKPVSTSWGPIRFRLGPPTAGPGTLPPGWPPFKFAPTTTRKCCIELVVEPKPGTYVKPIYPPDYPKPKFRNPYQEEIRFQQRQKEANKKSYTEAIAVQKYMPYDGPATLPPRPKELPTPTAMDPAKHRYPYIESTDNHTRIVKQFEEVHASRIKKMEEIKRANYIGPEWNCPKNVISCPCCCAWMEHYVNKPVHLDVVSKCRKMEKYGNKSYMEVCGNCTDYTSALILNGWKCKKALIDDLAKNNKKSIDEGMRLSFSGISKSTQLGSESDDERKETEEKKSRNEAELKEGTNERKEDTADVEDEEEKDSKSHSDKVKRSAHRGRHDDESKRKMIGRRRSQDDDYESERKMIGRRRSQDDDDESERKMIGRRRSQDDDDESERKMIGRRRSQDDDDESESKMIGRRRSKDDDDEDYFSDEFDDDESMHKSRSYNSTDDYMSVSRAGLPPRQELQQKELREEYCDYEKEKESCECCCAWMEGNIPIPKKEKINQWWWICGDMDSSKGYNYGHHRVCDCTRVIAHTVSHAVICAQRGGPLNPPAGTSRPTVNPEFDQFYDST